VTRGRSSLLSLLSLLGGSACARTPAAAPRTDDACVLALEVASIAHHWTVVRGLRPRTDLRAEILDDDEFLKRLESSGPNSAVADKQWQLATALRSVFNVRDARGLLPKDRLELPRERVDGFFSMQASAFFVRRRTWTDDGIGGLRRLIIHELEHALQDQTFPRPGPFENADEELAARAVWEGDATVASWVFTRPASSVRETLLAQEKWALAAAGRTYEPEPFPYVAGAAFLTVAYDAGAFPAIDQVFLALPTTTEQVLHPEKYFLGELPIPVATPNVPKGTTGIVKGRMGELRTRWILAQCLPTWEARDAARGWGGDAYVVFQTAAQALGVIWVTAWDDEAAATRFADGLRAQRKCWDAPPSEGAAATTVVPPDVAITQDGARVLLLRGAAQLDWPKNAELFPLVGVKPPPQPPRGAPSLVPPPVDLRTDVDATLTEGLWRSPLLGASMSVPPGWSADLEDYGAALVISPHASLLPHAFGKAQIILETFAGEALFDDLGARITKGGLQPELRTDEKAQVAGALGRRRVYSVHGSVRGTVRLFARPICARKATLLMTSFAATAEDDVALETWAASLRLVDDPPACSK
jgi:hypothetical protein